MEFTLTLDREVKHSVVYRSSQFGTVYVPKTVLESAEFPAPGSERLYGEGYYPSRLRLVVSEPGPRLRFEEAPPS